MPLDALVPSSSSASTTTTTTAAGRHPFSLVRPPTPPPAPEQKTNKNDDSYISLYNSLMKLVFLASSAAILFLMRGAKGIRQTRDAAHDTFRVAFLVAPAALLALLFSADRRGLMETAWTFSILLEAVAILPQLVLLQRTGNVDNLTGDYVFLLGTYRAFYLVNWFYRWMTEPGYKQWLGEERERERGRDGGVLVFSFFLSFPFLRVDAALSRLSFFPFSPAHLFPSSFFPPKNNKNRFSLSVDLRHASDGPVPRFLLLLPPRVEEQREA